MASVVERDRLTRSTRVALCVLSGITLLGLSLRLGAFAGYVGIDDVTYISDAYRLADGRLNVSTYFGTARLGMTGTLAVVFYAFGPGLGAVVVQPLFWSLLAIPLAYATSKIVFGDTRVALLSSLFVAIYPLDVIYATQYFPDLAAATLTWIAFLCFYAGEKTSKGHWYLAAGGALGVAYLHKETALLTLLPLAIFLSYQQRWRRGYLWLGAAFLMVLAAEMIAFGCLFHDPLYRLHALAPIGMDTNAPSRAAYDQIRPGGLLLGPVVALVTNQEYGLFYPMIALAIVSLVRRGDRASAPLLLYFLTVGLYTLYGPTSIRAYRHLRPLERYTLPLTIPGTVMLARWMWLCVRPRWRWAICGLLVVSWLVGIYVDNSRTFRSIGYALREFHSRHPDKSVVLHSDAYMSLFVANGFRPPSNTAVFAWEAQSWYAGSGHARRIDPCIRVYSDESELADCYVAVPLDQEAPVPPSWTEVARCVRTRRWFVGPLESWGDLWAWLARRLSPEMGFVIYYVPPAESNRPGA